MDKPLRFVQANYMIPLNCKWEIINESWLTELSISDNQSYREIDLLISEYQKNPLSFALMHGRKRNDAQGNDGRAFVNDWKHDLTMLTAGPQDGKSHAGAVKAGLFVGKCDPEWTCFKEHGIEYREWPGNTEIIIASFNMSQLRVLWNTYRKIWPREWLGRYSPSWGQFPGENGRSKTIAFGSGKPIVIVLEPIGCQITMLTYSQSIEYWQGRQCDLGHLDEQPKEDNFDSLTERMLARGDLTPMFATLTPFLVRGREGDTGANSFLKQKIIDSGLKEPKGVTWKEYKIPTATVPDEIMSRIKKKKHYIRNVINPKKMNDDRAIRAGRSKWFAEWEKGGGTILDEINEEIHFIEPFDLKEYYPTYFRFIDHGKDPCAVLLIALFEWGDAVVFKEYYEFGNSVAVNAQNIVENMCGNTRMSEPNFEENGASWPRFQEISSNMEFSESECDGKSFASPSTESTRTIGELYNDNGLWCYAADMSHRELRSDKGGTIQLLQEWITLVKERPHINIKLKREAPKMAELYGSPRLYFFNDLEYTRAEVSRWCRNPKTGKPEDKEDHLISDLLFWAARDRQYCGDWRFHNDDEMLPTRKVRNTGY